MDKKGGGSWKLDNFMDVLCVSPLSSVCLLYTSQLHDRTTLLFVRNQGQAPALKVASTFKISRTQNCLTDA